MKTYAQYRTITSDKFFRRKSGTIQCSAGYPTGINKKGLSFSGLFKTAVKKFIGLGVCVNATSPAWWIAANKKPEANPTDSVT